MKKIIIISLLFLPLIASAQRTGKLPYQTVRQTYRGDTIETTIGDTVKYRTNADAYKFDKILVVRDSTLLEIIQEHGGTGGEIYASNGTYKDGDTVKLGGGTRIKDNTTIGEQSNSIIYFDNQYQKGIMLYVSKKPSGSAQSVSSIQLKSHYNPSLLPTEKLDSSTYIQFTSTHIPVKTSGKYAEARFNENGFYYTDTLRGRNANNPRWIPDKDYIDSVSGASNIFVVSNDTIFLIDGSHVVNLSNATSKPKIRVNNSSIGTAIDIQNSSTGYAIHSHNGGTTSFLVSHDGNVTATKYYVSALNTAPSSATDTGTTGEIRVTATHIYVCTATNTWVRTALTTW